MATPNALLQSLARIGLVVLAAVAVALACPEGTQPVWRFFEWQAIIPAGTMISIAVQTKQDLADPYGPSEPVPLDPIVATTPPGVWVHGTRTVDTALHEITGNAGASLRYLLVSLEFHPDATGTIAPTLANWRQVYDCIDAQ